jgi:hypothetical protein
MPDGVYLHTKLNISSKDASLRMFVSQDVTDNDQQDLKDSLMHFKQ